MCEYINSRLNLIPNNINFCYYCFLKYNMKDSENCYIHHLLYILGYFHYLFFFLDLFSIKHKICTYDIKWYKIHIEIENLCN